MAWLSIVCEMTERNFQHVSDAKLVSRMSDLPSVGQQVKTCNCVDTRIRGRGTGGKGVHATTISPFKTLCNVAKYFQN